MFTRRWCGGFTRRWSGGFTRRRRAAAAVAFVHNHPSGNPDPSRDDREITARLVEAAKLLGIRVLDHVILGRNGYFSFVEEGLM